jgi:hypothetical protein
VQGAGDQLCKLVFVTLAGLIGHRHIAGIGADPEGAESQGASGLACRIYFDLRIIFELAIAVGSLCRRMSAEGNQAHGQKKTMDVQ